MEPIRLIIACSILISLASGTYYYRRPYFRIKTTRVKPEVAVENSPSEELNELGRSEPVSEDKDDSGGSGVEKHKNQENGEKADKNGGNTIKNHQGILNPIYNSLNHVNAPVNPIYNPFYAGNSKGSPQSPVYNPQNVPNALFYNTLHRIHSQAVANSVQNPLNQVTSQGSGNSNLYNPFLQVNSQGLTGSFYNPLVKVNPQGFGNPILNPFYQVNTQGLSNPALYNPFLQGPASASVNNPLDKINSQYLASLGYNQLLQANSQVQTNLVQNPLDKINSQVSAAPGYNPLLQNNLQVQNPVYNPLDKVNPQGSVPHSTYNALLQANVQSQIPANPVFNPLDKTTPQFTGNPNYNPLLQGNSQIQANAVYNPLNKGNPQVPVSNFAYNPSLQIAAQDSTNILPNPLDKVTSQGAALDKVNSQEPLNPAPNQGSVSNPLYQVNSQGSNPVYLVPSGQDIKTVNASARPVGAFGTLLIPGFPGFQLGAGLAGGFTGSGEATGNSAQEGSQAVQESNSVQGGSFFAAGGINGAVATQTAHEQPVKHPAESTTHEATYVSGGVHNSGYVSPTVHVQPVHPVSESTGVHGGTYVTGGYGSTGTYVPPVLPIGVNYVSGGLQNVGYAPTITHLQPFHHITEGTGTFATAGAGTGIFPGSYVPVYFQQTPVHHSAQTPVHTPVQSTGENNGGFSASGAISGSVVVPSNSILASFFHQEPNSNQQEQSSHQEPVTQQEQSSQSEPSVEAAPPASASSALGGIEYQERHIGSNSDKNPEVSGKTYHVRPVANRRPVGYPTGYPAKYTTGYPAKYPTGLPAGTVIYPVDTRDHQTQTQSHQFVVSGLPNIHAAGSFGVSEGVALGQGEFVSHSVGAPLIITIPISHNSHAPEKPHQHPTGHHTGHTTEHHGEQPQLVQLFQQPIQYLGTIFRPPKPEGGGIKHPVNPAVVQPLVIQNLSKPPSTGIIKEEEFTHVIVDSNGGVSSPGEEIDDDLDEEYGKEYARSIPPTDVIGDSNEKVPCHFDVEAQEIEAVQRTEAPEDNEVIDAAEERKSVSDSEVIQEKETTQRIEVVQAKESVQEKEVPKDKDATRSAQTVSEVTEDPSSGLNTVTDTVLNAVPSKEETSFDVESKE